VRTEHDGALSMQGAPDAIIGRRPLLIFHFSSSRLICRKRRWHAVMFTCGGSQ